MTPRDGSVPIAADEELAPVFTVVVVAASVSMSHFMERVAFPLNATKLLPAAQYVPYSNFQHLVRRHLVLNAPPALDTVVSRNCVSKLSMMTSQTSQRAQRLGVRTLTVQQHQVIELRWAVAEASLRVPVVLLRPWSEARPYHRTIASRLFGHSDTPAHLSMLKIHSSRTFLLDRFALCDVDDRKFRSDHARDVKGNIGQLGLSGSLRAERKEKAVGDAAKATILSP